MPWAKRIIGIVGVILFGLLCFQNFVALSFSPPGEGKITVGFLAIFFALAAAGGVGVVMHKAWGRKFVVAGSVLVLAVSYLGGYLVTHGHRVPLVIDLLHQTSLYEWLRMAGVPFLGLIVHFYYLAAIIVLVFF